MNRQISLARGAALIFFVALVGFFVVALPGRGQVDVSWARFSWNAPTVGTPVDHYVVQVEYNTGAPYNFIRTFEDVTVLYLDFEVEGGKEYRARVAGVDAQGRQGPWSTWTTRFGPPPSDPSFGPFH